MAIDLDLPAAVRSFMGCRSRYRGRAWATTNRAAGNRAAGRDTLVGLLLLRRLFDVVRWILEAGLHS